MVKIGEKMVSSGLNTHLDKSKYLTKIIEMSNHSFLVIDRDGQIQHYNSAAKKMYRFDPFHQPLHIWELPQTDIVHLLRNDAFPTVLERGYWSGEAIFVNSEGYEIPASIVVTANNNDAGELQYFSIFTRDITAQKEHGERERLATNVLHNIIEGVVVTDPNSTIISVNRAFTNVTGYREDEVIGKKPSILSSGIHDKGFYEVMWKEILERGVWKGEVWNRHKNGKIYLQKLTISSVKGDQGSTEYYVSLIEDITEKKELEERIAFQAFHDPLTLLPNRYSFQNKLVEMIEHSCGDVAILLLNLDRFKRINDSLGHHVGDQVLRAVADRLVRAIGNLGMVFHLGGDQFIIMLTNRSERESVFDANYILEQMRYPFYLEENEFFLGGSIGIALYPRDGRDMTTLLQHADLALYKAKKMGRNNAQVYHSNTEHHSVELLELENDLHKAIEQDQFILYYQPQLEISSGKIIGAETLVRWNHPEMGILSPIKFIPLAEESGLILKLDEIVLRRACEQAVAWVKQGHTPIKISVNLSMLHFNKREIIHRVFAILDETGMDPRQLEIELTESAVMNNPDLAFQILSAFREKGIKIAVDDFGTGYSSLGYLQKLPIHSLKIDRSFINDITENEESRALVRSIIQLALNLGLTVVAEGIETYDQLQLMRDYECTVAQGYLIGKPMPTTEFEQKIVK